MSTHTLSRLRRHSPRPKLALALAVVLAGTVCLGIAPPGHAEEHASVAKPPIGRIFFSPAERRNRRGAELAATSSPAADARIGGRLVPGKRLVVNGALSSSTQGRAVWVNGAVVENSAHDKPAWTDRNGNVWLINQDHKTRLIRPGQSIRQGLVEDLLPPGAVTRR